MAGRKGARCYRCKNKAEQGWLVRHSFHKAQEHPVQRETPKTKKLHSVLILRNIDPDPALSES